MMIKSINETFKECKFFYLVGVLILLLTGVMLTLITKAESFIFVNQIRAEYLDLFFSRYTYVGDGVFTLMVVMLLLILKQPKLAACVLLAYITSGCFAQILKHLTYAPRPKAYFEMSGMSYRINFFETSHSGNNSFPSGHTTSAFALATVLAAHFRKSYQAMLLLAGAILVGYSRIYTGEHFPLDVWTAAWIGIFFGLMSVLLLKNTNLSIPRFKRRRQLSGTEISFAK